MAIRSLKSGLFTRSGMAGNPIILPGAYESIATTTVGAGGTSSITFSSIPSTYKHLQIRGISRTPSNATYMYVTTSSGANYGLKGHWLSGTGTSAVAGSAGPTASKGLMLDVYVGSLITNQFGPQIIDILDYADTNKYKTFKALTGYDDASSSVNLMSGVFDTTNAITSVTLYANGNYPQYSSFALYGIQG